MKIILANTINIGVMSFVFFIIGLRFKYLILVKAKEFTKDYGNDFEEEWFPILYWSTFFANQESIKYIWMLFTNEILLISAILGVIIAILYGYINGLFFGIIGLGLSLGGLVFLCMIIGKSLLYMKELGKSMITYYR